MITPNHMIEEYSKYRGQFVIIKSPIRLNDFVVHRFIGIAESHRDCYYVTFDGNDIYMTTGVTSIIPLKGFISDRGYNQLCRAARLNHLDYLYHSWDNEEFQKQISAQLSLYENRGYKLVTELCWELK
jgi:hypothetical protein